MSKQKIEIEVDIPLGYEATGEFRHMREGDFAFDVDWNVHSFAWNAARFKMPIIKLILRRVEPLSIQACRVLSNAYTPNSNHDLDDDIGGLSDVQDLIKAIRLSRKAIAEYERAELCK